jgi:hypothetical protein
LEVFIEAHDNYDYDELCAEINKKQKIKDEYFEKFLLRVVTIYVIFFESVKPCIFEFFTVCSYLFSFPIEEKSLMSNEKDLSYQEYPPP